MPPATWGDVGHKCKFPAIVRHGLRLSRTSSSSLSSEQIEQVKEMGFSIQKELDAGAFGTVVEARHEHEATVYALKVLHNSHAMSPQDRRRLERLSERTSADLGGVAARHFYGKSHLDVPIVLVMEKVPGVTLRQWLEMERTLADRKRLAIGLCDGVAQLHQIGIAHRDLHPANIMVRPDQRPVLIDFGLARDALDAKTNVTRGSTLAPLGWGCEPYAAPEQRSGDLLPTDALRADVHALGWLVAYILIGDGEHPPSNLEHYLRRLPTQDLWTREIATLVGQCATQRPTDRPRSAEDVRRRLHRILDRKYRGPGDLSVGLWHLASSPLSGVPSTTWVEDRAGHFALELSLSSSSALPDDVLASWRACDAPATLARPLAWRANRRGDVGQVVVTPPLRPCGSLLKLAKDEDFSLTPRAMGRAVADALRLWRWLDGSGHTFDLHADDVYVGEDGLLWVSRVRLRSQSASLGHGAVASALRRLAARSRGRQVVHSVENDLGIREVRFSMDLQSPRLLATVLAAERVIEDVFHIEEERDVTPLIEAILLELADLERGVALSEEDIGRRSEVLSQLEVALVPTPEARCWPRRFGFHEADAARGNTLAALRTAFERDERDRRAQHDRDEQERYARHEHDEQERRARHEHDEQERQRMPDTEMGQVVPWENQEQLFVPKDHEEHSFSPVSFETYLNQSRPTWASGEWRGGWDDGEEFIEIPAYRLALTLRSAAARPAEEIPSRRLVAKLVDHLDALRKAVAQVEQMQRSSHAIDPSPVKATSLAFVQLRSLTWYLVCAHSVRENTPWEEFSCHWRPWLYTDGGCWSRGMPDWFKDRDAALAGALRACGPDACDGFPDPVKIRVWAEALERVLAPGLAPLLRGVGSETTQDEEDGHPWVETEPYFIGGVWCHGPDPLEEEEEWAYFGAPPFEPLQRHRRSRAQPG